MPKIQITAEWKNYLLYVPVIEAVVPADPTVIPIKVSIRHLVSDFYDWNRRTKRLEPYEDNGQNARLLKSLTKGIRKRHWFWHEAVRRTMETSSNTSINKKLPVLLKEWGLFQAMTDNQPILIAKPGTFRKYWDDQENQQKEVILLNGLGSPAISGQAWKTVWRMEIPHAIRTPWWRTLQQKIPTNRGLHNIFPKCEYKWRFWMRMMKLKKIPPEIWSQGKVWNMILLQQTRPQDVQIFSEIGRTMLVIWITHWNCIKQQKEWSDQAAYNMYESIIKPTNDRNFQPKENKSCNGWITIVQAGTTQGVEACVWKMCRCYQCPNKEGFPGGRPSTDFELVSPFQIIFDPKMKQRDHIDWLLAPWRDLTFMKLEVDHIVA